MGSVAKSWDQKSMFIAILFGIIRVARQQAALFDISSPTQVFERYHNLLALNIPGQVPSIRLHVPFAFLVDDLRPMLRLVSGIYVVQVTSSSMERALSAISTAGGSSFN